MALGFSGSLLGLGVDSGWYQAVLVVHLASAVVGFGGSAVGTVMLRRAWADGPDAAAAVRRSFEFASNRLVDVAAYLTGIAGAVAVLVGPWNFRQDWVTLAFVLYFAWLAIAHGALRPTGAKLAAALEAEPLGEAGARAARERSEQEREATGATTGSLTHARGSSEAAARPGSPEPAGDAERLRRRAELWSALSNLVIVAAIVVMVVKPNW